jgi:hypothetical protein
MVLSFLDHIVRHYRRGPIVIITDNISMRTGNAAAAWLDRHPRVRFVFTPAHGSWLNQVEIWLGILTRLALRTAPSLTCASSPQRPLNSASTGTMFSAGPSNGPTPAASFKLERQMRYNFWDAALIAE